MNVLIEEHRDAWRIPKSTDTQRFIEVWEKRGRLHLLNLVAEDRPHLAVSRYAWGSPSPFAVALSLRSGSYLSHTSAVFAHGLSKQIPEVIYVNREQSPKPRPDATSLTQQTLDRAFANKPRESTFIYLHERSRIALLSGKATSNLEVRDGKIDGVRVLRTNLERTLIDIAVRPIYCGGPSGVLAAYKGARPRVNVALLLKTLRQLDYIYPYHQAIGFYMERAGFPETQLAKVAEVEMKFDFHLANRIESRAYSRRWRLYHPAEI
jgi:predicted transcriptional regulator of viral defense system